MAAPYQYVFIMSFHPPKSHMGIKDIKHNTERVARSVPYPFYCSSTDRTVLFSHCGHLFFEIMNEQ